MKRDLKMQEWIILIHFLREIACTNSRQNPIPFHNQEKYYNIVNHFNVKKLITDWTLFLDADTVSSD